MKRILATTAILASMLASAPLAAQPGYGSQGYRGDWNSGRFWQGAPSDVWQRIQFLQRRIDRGIQDGSLTRGEARRAQVRLGQIRQDAARMRRDGFSGREQASIQAQLDDLSRNLRWSRNNGQYGYQGGGYGGGYGRDGGFDEARFRTDYDARRYYRDGAQYQERRLGPDDEVYRGSDGRYYCKRNDGTTGLIVGGVAGGVLGNVVDGGHNRVAGTLIGGALGAILGKTVDQNNSDVRCR